MADEHTQIDDKVLERFVESNEHVQRLHEDILCANEIIEEEGLETDDAAELVVMINESWKYMNHVFIVSGKSYTTDSEAVLLDGKKVASLGSGLVRLSDGEVKIYHQLGVIDDDQVVDSLWIDPGENEILHIKPLSRTEEEIIGDFEYHLPELKAELDMVILNRADTAEALEKLRSFVFKHDPEVDLDEFRIMVESYLNKILDVAKLPRYRIEFRGLYFKATSSGNDNEEEPTFKQSNTSNWEQIVVKPTGIILFPAAYMGAGYEPSKDVDEFVTSLFATRADNGLEDGSSDTFIIPITASCFKVAGVVKDFQEDVEGLVLER